jgi:hypothetical protein
VKHLQINCTILKPRLEVSFTRNKHTTLVPTSNTFQILENKDGRLFIDHKV